MNHIKRDALSEIEARIRAAEGEDIGAMTTLVEAGIRLGDVASMTPAREIMFGCLLMHLASIGLRSLQIDPSDVTKTIAGKTEVLESALKRPSIPRVALIHCLVSILTKIEEKVRKNFLKKLEPYLFGNDGHPLTREAAAALKLVRVYEPVSSDFSAILAKVFASMQYIYSDYRIWFERYPLFCCDLTNATHREAARRMVEATNGDIAIITPRIPKEIQEQMRTEFGPDVKFKIAFDHDNLVAQLLALRAPAVLIERRFGGWTLTYPLGHPDLRELNKPIYPSWIRSLARCA